VIELFILCLAPFTKLKVTVYNLKLTYRFFNRLLKFSHVSFVLLFDYKLFLFELHFDNSLTNIGHSIPDVFAFNMCKDSHQMVRLYLKRFFFWILYIRNIKITT